MRHWPSLCLLSLLCLLQGCTEPRQLAFTAPAVMPQPDTPTLMAGVARTDITPPPGMPKAGYSSNAQTGKGVRTRLHARAFWIKPRHGAPLALVQLDLLAGSNLLHHRVAELIGEAGVPAQNLVLLATHTHAGPGQFLGSNFYNRFASNENGFDPVYFEFLAQQIATAIRQAAAEQRPARLATGQRDIWGWTRNRSLDPHTHNSNVADKSLAAQKKFYAINPTLFMLRIDGRSDSGEFLPMGALSFFSIHGTGVPQQSDEYNADVWAYINEDVAWNIRREWPNLPWQPVHGAAEGTHADIAPALRFGMAGYIDARRVGSGIASEAWELFRQLGGNLQDDMPLRSAFREVDVFQHPEINGASLCERPVVGAALAAGASENLTPVIHMLPPFKAGWPRSWFVNGCQKEKRWLGWYFQPLVLSRDDFPHVLPVQILQLGDMAIAALPFEITAEAGRRIAARILEAFQAANEPVRHMVVSSVANDYAGYATTPEEYSRQFYEGGHTLYGPGTQAFLAEQTHALAADLLKQGQVADFVPWQYQISSHRFMPEAAAAQGPRRSLAAPVYVDAEANREGYWEWSWADVPPATIEWHKPLARVEYSDDGQHWQALAQAGWPVDDQGYDMALRHDTSLVGEDLHAYQVRWFNPEFHPSRQYRFVIAARGDKPAFLSPAFR